ncbi:hypothetical protein HS042_24470 [Serratia marcescens]|uniref:hypothetical protein n=1 Tax=Serratia marcescens TaxID=615 RepID=UPI0018C314C5|nr:hypothetical protein [Serratia marcescens]QPJ91269.1 hypothetical protein HS042_24470 [Serratia marcescens]
MKERPVIFNSEMVRAILSGRKTQTRRVIANVSPDNCIPLQKPTKTKDGIYTHVMDAPGHGLCPFGQVGDRLWVRETWADVNHDGHPAIAYRADGGLRVIGEDDGEEEDPNLEKYWFAQWYADLISGAEGNWRPSIHMPRWASRITLEITAVRVERLNDISEEDAKAEGVRAIENNFGNGPSYCDYLLPNLDDTAEWYNRASDSFKSLWKSIYGAESWRANPWVWVIEFRRVEVEK